MVEGLPQKLEEVVAELKARRALLSEEELTQRSSGQLRTEIPELDRLLGGGLPLGKLVELLHTRKGAATAVAYRVLARSTAVGHAVALCDLAMAFDPRMALLAGADLERLFCARPRTTRAALQSADALLYSGAFPLVVLDLGQGLGRERPPPRASWLRLSRRAELARAGLLVLASERWGPGALASVCLQPGPARSRFTGQGLNRTYEGTEVTLERVRNKLGLPPGKARVFFSALPERPGGAP